MDRNQFVSAYVVNGAQDGQPVETQYCKDLADNIYKTGPVICYNPNFGADKNGKILDWVKVDNLPENAEYIGRYVKPLNLPQ